MNYFDVVLLNKEHSFSEELFCSSENEWDLSLKGSGMVILQV